MRKPWWRSHDPNDSAKITSDEISPRLAWRYIFSSRSAHVRARERSPFILPFPSDPFLSFFRAFLGNDEEASPITQGRAR